MFKFQNNNGTERKEPKEFKLLGSGSDHAPFAFFANIPAVQVMFKTDEKKYGVGWYPTYHTGFETFYLVDKIVDPGFKIHRTCAQVIQLMFVDIIKGGIKRFQLMGSKPS